MSTLISHHATLPNGQTLHYVDNGAAGPAIVFLHGYTDSWRSFELVFPLLSPSFRLIALDQRGHGETPPAERYRIADFAADAIGFIEQLATGPVHLVGHSLGHHCRPARRGTTSRSPAEPHPDRSGPHSPGASGLLEFREELKQLGDRVPIDFIEQFQAGTTKVPLPDAQLAIFVAESAKLDLDTWTGALDGLIDEPAGLPDLPADLAILTLWGEEDTIFDREAQLALSHAATRHTAINYPDVAMRRIGRFRHALPMTSGASFRCITGQQTPNKELRRCQRTRRDLQSREQPLRRICSIWRSPTITPGRATRSLPPRGNRAGSRFQPGAQRHRIPAHA